MTGNEVAVVVIDATPSGHEDPRTTAEVAEDRLHGILEGGLLVAIGLSALAVDGIVSAILRTSGVSAPADGSPDGSGTGRDQRHGHAPNGHGDRLRGRSP